MPLSQPIGLTPMRFKRHRRTSAIPEVNLVPMLDVLMTVLTFFIIVSMTLTLEQGVEVQLPRQETPPGQAEPTPLIVQIKPQNQLFLNNQPIAKPQLNAEIQGYLKANPKGGVVLQADRQLPYEQVVQLLGEMKGIGGSQVSLAIE